MSLMLSVLRMAMFCNFCFMPLPPDIVGEGIAFWPVLLECLSVHPVRYCYRHISRTALIICDKTDRQCLFAPTDDLIRLWRLKVKVLQACRGR